MNRASVSEWHNGFKESRETTRNDVSCGRSKEVNAPVDWPKGYGYGYYVEDLREFRK